MSLETASASPVRHILACITLTARGEALAAEVTRIAAPLAADISFLHVGTDDPRTRLALQELLARARAPESAGVIITEGKPAEIVCQTASTIGADMIVAGAFVNEGTLEYYIGSVARKIARRAPCSVLLLTTPTPTQDPLKTAAVTVDFAESSRDTLAFAVDFVKRFGAETLHVLSEYELPALRTGFDDAFDLREEQQMQNALQADEATRLRDFVAGIDFRGIEIRLVPLQGKKGNASSEYAREHGLDLLIASAPGRKMGLLDKLFQHDIEFVLETLPCEFLLHRSGAPGTT
jgi:nucleotide-binding universal stress UspA family protein